MYIIYIYIIYIYIIYIYYIPYINITCVHILVNIMCRYGESMAVSLRPH